MKQFESIGREPPKIIETKVGQVVFTPTFNTGDNVNVKPSMKQYSSELGRLHGQVLIVDYCKVADLGDIVTEVLYLKHIEGVEINNPYLVGHFEPLLL